MNFIIFSIVMLLGAAGLFWLEDKTKKYGDPIPQSIVCLGILLVAFLAFCISIIV
jgi:FtsH-binding integral membrane protein